MDAYINFDGTVALSLMESKTSVGCICLKFGIPERSVRKFNNKNSFKFEKQWQNVETKTRIPKLYDTILNIWHWVMVSRRMELVAVTLAEQNDYG